MDTLVNFDFYLETLKKQLSSKISFKVKRPGIVQLIAPFFHEDGDMVDIYLEKSKDSPGKIKISDYGKTLMRLSYSYDIDTPNKHKIFNRIVDENSIQEDSGILFLEVVPEELTAGVFQFVQAAAKVSNMRHFSKEVIKSMFYESLRDFICTELDKFNPSIKVNPLQHRDDLEVDYAFALAPKQLYLFAVRGVSKSRLATICCLEFQKANLPFRSIIVHEDFDSLPKKDRDRLTSAADKQFIDLDDFKQHGPSYLEREAS